MHAMLPLIETLTVEFKSDRKRLSDVELIEAVVCLANAEGGDLWLGVEDDGTPTGLHPDHQMLTGLAGMVPTHEFAFQVMAQQSVKFNEFRRYVRQHGRIKRAEAMELCRLSGGQVKALLKRMCQSNLLTLAGAGPASYYRIGASDRMKLDEIGSDIRFLGGHGMVAGLT